MVTRRRALDSSLDGLEIAFDDERPIAEAGLVLPAILSERLGVQQALDAAVQSERQPSIGAGAGATGRSDIAAWRSRGALSGTPADVDYDCRRAGPGGSTSSRWSA